MPRLRLDSFIRLIEVADFGTFRELVLLYLSTRGFTEPVLTDGWKDGGTDLRVLQMPQTTAPVAFQTTVERRWKTKLYKDAEKVVNNFGLKRMFFIRSHRIAEAEFQPEADRILKELDVLVTRADSQTIASTFFTSGKIRDALEILGYSVEQPLGAGVEGHDLRNEAAYSYVFFGKDTNRFREALIESTIITVLSHKPDELNRESLELAVQDVLQIEDEQRRLITSAVDSMMQKGRIRVENNIFKPDEKELEAATSLEALRDVEWAQFRVEIKSLITSKTKSRSIDDAVIDSIIDDLGALLLETAKSASLTKDRSQLRLSFTQEINHRIRHLHATCDTIGIPEGSKRVQIFRELVDLASNSEIGKSIMAGELFICMVNVRTLHLVTAFGAQAGIEILLDASVAIPMLCGLLYHPTTDSASLTAMHAYNQIISRGIPLFLPDVYLEEIATHLLLAHRTYAPIVGTDPDLAVSENAFVSHFTNLSLEGYKGTFQEYLEGFGLHSRIRGMGFDIARSQLMNSLRRILGQYRIQHRGLGKLPSQSRRRADFKIMEAISEIPLERHEIVLGHDARVIAYLYESDKSSHNANILCTWDRLHFWIRENEDVFWEVINPALLGDLISLTSPEQVTGRIASPATIAKHLLEQDARRGAKVWDRIVSIESEDLYDVQIREQAVDFKHDYLTRLQRGELVESISEEWGKWKEKYVDTETE